MLMPSAASIRRHVEATLADRIPSALTPRAQFVRPTAPTGIEAVDALIEGGLPVGAITEIVGPDCSGRTALASAFVARVTQGGKVAAWIDVMNSLDPESLAATGVDLRRLLWVRCGVAAKVQKSIVKSEYKVDLPAKYFEPPVTKQGLHGGGFGSHPRGEGKGIPESIAGLLSPHTYEPRCAVAAGRVSARKVQVSPQEMPSRVTREQVVAMKPWARIEQALKSADLLLQGGGFSAIVLDMAGVAPEYSSRVPLGTWFRYRGAAERSRTSFLLLTQHPCTKSSAGLVLQLQLGNIIAEQTVLLGLEHHVEVIRQRFSQASSKVVEMRKPVQRETTAKWQTRTAWASR